MLFVTCFCASGSRDRTMRAQVEYSYSGTVPFNEHEDRMEVDQPPCNCGACKRSESSEEVEKMESEAVSAVEVGPAIMPHSTRMVVVEN